MIMYGGGRQDATWDAREVPRPPLPHHCNALTTQNFTNSVWKTFYPGNQHYLLTSKIQRQFLPWKNPVALRDGLAAGTSRKGKSKIKSKSKARRRRILKILIPKTKI